MHLRCGKTSTDVADSIRFLVHYFALLTTLPDVQAVYNQLKGVDSAISGYTGGRTVKPTYEQVSSKHHHVDECTRLSTCSGLVELVAPHREMLLVPAFESQTGSELYHCVCAP